MNNELLEGRRLLRELLPRARQETMNVDNASMSSLMKATLPFITEENLDALLVYEAPVTGGWLADLVFKNVPPGVCNIFGTPTGYPHLTREAAIEYGVTLISLALTMSSQKPTVSEDTKPAFLYFGTVFSLDTAMLGFLIAQGAKYDSIKHAHDRINEVTQSLFRDRRRPTFERIQSLLKDDVARLMSVLYMAAMTGVLRYPPIEPGIPGDTFIMDQDDDSDRASETEPS